MWRQCDGRSFAHKKLCRSLHLQVGLQQRHRGTHQRQTGTVTQYWNFKLDLRYFVMFVKFSFAVIHFWFIPKIMTSFLDQLRLENSVFFQRKPFHSKFRNQRLIASVIPKRCLSFWRIYAKRFRKENGAKLRRTRDWGLRHRTQMTTWLNLIR